MAPHSSTLAWKIPWTEEPGGLPSMGSQRVGHDSATNTYLLINLFCVSCLEKFLYHLLKSWFGGAEFSQVLLVCKAFISPAYLNEILTGYRMWVVGFSLSSF